VNKRKGSDIGPTTALTSWESLNNVVKTSQADQRVIKRAIEISAGSLADFAADMRLRQKQIICVDVARIRFQP